MMLFRAREIASVYDQLTKEFFDVDFRYLRIVRSQKNNVENYGKRLASVQTLIDLASQARMEPADFMRAQFEILAPRLKEASAGRRKIIPFSWLISANAIGRLQLKEAPERIFYHGQKKEDAMSSYSDMFNAGVRRLATRLDKLSVAFTITKEIAADELSFLARFGVADAVYVFAWVHLHHPEKTDLIKIAKDYAATLKPGAEREIFWAHKKALEKHGGPYAEYL